MTKHIGDWVRVTKLPIPVSNFQIVKLTDSEVYLLGGETHDDRMLSSTYKIYIEDNENLYMRWDKGENLPKPLGHSQSIVFNNKIYLLGGKEGILDFTSDIYVSSIDDNNMLKNWNITGKLPVKLSNFKATLIKDKIYILGGYAEGKEYMYEITKDIYSTTIGDNSELYEWKKVGSLPGYITKFEAITIGNRIYLIGGYDYNLSCVISDVYTTVVDEDGNINEWRKINSLPIPLLNLRGVVIKDSMYLFGGEHRIETIDDDSVIENTQIVLSADIEDNNTGKLSNWKLVSLLPYPMSDFNIVTTNKYLYIFGGKRDDGVISDILAAPLL